MVTPNESNDIYMHPVIKRSIKQAFHLVGADIRWHIPQPRHCLPTLLELYKVDTIFDIGANAGVSGEYFRNIGFKQKIVSFEPVGHLYRQLEQRVNNDSLWDCENTAIGDALGELTLNVSGDCGGASSFLRMTDNIVINAPELAVIGQEIVKVKTIDSLIGTYYPKGNRLFLKIDVQGFEKNVIEGARASLERIVGMKIELSLVKNYENENLLCDMLPYLYGLGFRLCAVEHAWSNLATQELYQIDGILFRPEMLSSSTS